MACFYLNKFGDSSWLQVAIIARSSREMSKTVRIDWRSFLSRVCISVRYRIFIGEKHPRTIVETESPERVVGWMNQRPVTVDRQQPVKRCDNCGHGCSPATRRKATTWTATTAPKWRKISTSKRRQPEFIPSRSDKMLTHGLRRPNCVCNL